MPIFCWVQGEPDLVSYNGNFRLSRSQKSVVFDNWVLPALPAVRFENLEIYTKEPNSFTVKTLALNKRNQVIPLLAYSQYNPVTSSFNIQAEDTTKALYEFADRIGVNIIPMGNMRLGIRLACKFNGLDLYNLYETLKNLNLLDPNFVQGMNVVGSIASPIIIGTVNVFKGAQRLIMEVALGLKDLLADISNILGFLSTVAMIVDVAKLAALISRWIDKKSEIAKYDRANNAQKNAQRLAYAKKIVGYLNNLDKTQQPLPKDVQQDLIKFFLNDQKDMADLYTVSDNLSRIAQNRPIMDRLRTAFGH